MSSVPYCCDVSFQEALNIGTNDAEEHKLLVPFCACGCCRISNPACFAGKSSSGKKSELFFQ